jgi:hypothetical protein
MGEYFSRGCLNEIELQTAVPLAGRKHLVGSNSAGFPKHLSGPKEDFPMLVKAKNGQEASMKHWALRCREIIDQAYQRYLLRKTMRMFVWLQFQRVQLPVGFVRPYKRITKFVIYELKCNNDIHTKF